MARIGREAFSVNVRLDAKQAAKQLGDISNKHVRAVTPQAINATIRAMRRNVLQFISKTKRVPQRIMRPKVRQTHRATARFPRATLRGDFSPISYPKLGNVTETRTGARVPRKGVIPGAFVARMPSGHLGVFKRRHETRPVGKGARQRPQARGALPIDEQRLRLNPEARRRMLRLNDRFSRLFFAKEFDARLRKRLDREARRAQSTRGAGRTRGTRR